MNKGEFIDRVAESAGLTRAAAARAVDAIFDTASGAISEAVHAAGAFSIPGFGKFTRKTRAARTGRNPRTGTEISIPERTTVSFTAGKGLKSRTSTSRRKAAATGAAVGAAVGAATAAATAPKGTKRASGATKSSTTATKSTASRSSASDSASGGKSNGASKSTGAAKSTGTKSAAKKSTAAKSTGSKSR
ncbi:MAG TPA: HU family DNA-binding protein [Longimicrobium sp.]|jgi:DNA-binding protein HU-beta